MVVATGLSEMHCLHYDINFMDIWQVTKKIKMTLQGYKLLLNNIHEL
jgi:hypothetical protein